MICISHITEIMLNEPIVNTWLHGGLLLSPFIPFNIIFCCLIETLDTIELNDLKQLVDILETKSQIPLFAAACSKQLSVFRVLHDVAARYVKVKTEIKMRRLFQPSRQT